MKKAVKAIALILAVAAVFALCACSSAPKSVKYTFFAMNMNGYNIEYSEMDGRYVILNDDGTGELDWGDDNSGPISEWTADGEKLVIKAGISEMDATLKDGILSVDVSDEDFTMTIIFAAEGADTSGMKVISQEEFAQLFTIDN